MAQQRRTRFTAYFPDGREPVVVLAYSLDQARDYYMRRGATRVVPGDYRRQAAYAQIKAKGGFKIDQAALKAACADLGIERPVKIRLNGRVGNTNGNHRFMGTHHAIMLKSYHTPQQATATLWHELCHAMQAERSGDLVAWREVRREQARYPYRVRPIEREARQMSAAKSHIPLTKPA